QLADCLLVRCGKLDRGTARSAWAKAFESAGVFVEFWPLERNQWPGWVEQRLHKVGLSATPEAVRLLVDRVEGNLLAAQQEIIKLSLLHDKGEIGLDEMRKAVTNSSRFDVFVLADVMLRGEFKRGLKILAALRDEGVEPVIVLWALVREWQILCHWLWQLQSGSSAGDIAKSLGVWPKRRPLFNAAVKRIQQQAKRQHESELTVSNDVICLANEADMTVKGFRSGRPWSALQSVLAAMCGESSLLALYAEKARFSGLAA
ncbi:MAG: DNA polymerase III subunit delta, partial [Gammaproteobacteria bacterium]|nr:DNA polymerase III subunit delta [Gammaproteobacteria bacterium]